MFDNSVHLCGSIRIVIPRRHQGPAPEYFSTLGIRIGGTRRVPVAVDQYAIFLRTNN